jgi:phosphonate transport system ATP-binding protein
MKTIRLHAVEKRFPNGCLALRGISLDIEPGTFTVILGPSGAGKSTLLRMFNGLEVPTRGQVEMGGRTLDRSSLRRLRGQVGMVFQQFNLVGRLSVMTNVLTGRLAYRSWLGSLLYLFRREDIAIAQEALERVGLTEKAWERADRLSGGQQQRVGIARALAQQPKIILADEPVASLDPVASDDIMQLLRDICDRDGITVLANLHQVEHARRHADRIVGLNNGTVVFQGTPRELDAISLERIYHREGAQHEEAFAPALAYA